MKTPSERLVEIVQKRQRSVLGVMSGMSMDGTDIAWIDISGTFPHLKIEIRGAGYRAYPTSLKERLLTMRAREHVGLDELCKLNAELGEVFAGAINDFMQAEGLQAHHIDAVGVHGQTVVHVPPTQSARGSTLQLGSASVIAERTGLLTVSNFRQRDMAAGGHGAPLVPLFDWLWYREQDATLVVQNLGSISNVTVVTPELDHVWAFDTGPANIAIDFFARTEGGVDDGGALSSNGTVNNAMLAMLMNNPYFHRDPPKSAGYAEFGPSLLSEIEARFDAVPTVDKVRTAVQFAAETIALAYENEIMVKHRDLKHVWLSGGGVRNPTLMRVLRQRLPTLNFQSVDAHPRCSLRRNDLTFSDIKEAMAFAVLANETLSGRCTTVSNATGAQHNVVSGEIALPAGV